MEWHVWLTVDVDLGSCGPQQRRASPGDAQTFISGLSMHSLFVQPWQVLALPSPLPPGCLKRHPCIGTLGVKHHMASFPPPPPPPVCFPGDLSCPPIGYWDPTLALSILYSAGQNTDAGEGGGMQPMDSVKKMGRWGPSRSN